MTWNKWLNWAYLELKESISPKRDAEILLEQIIKKPRVHILVYGETLFKKKDISKFKSLVFRRKQGEPIAYLTGSKEFWSLKFKVSSGVFIPRSDTECLIEQTLQLAPNLHNDVVDLGTGVGTIALALASERPLWNILGIEQQKKSLKLAKKNKLSLNLKNIKFVYGNWFQFLKQQFDIIVSNPPYIAQNDPCLLKKDMSYEPKKALVSNKLGLEDLTKICQYSIKHLNKNGWLILEHGWNQGEYMRALFKKVGFCNVDTVIDYNNFERVTYGQWLCC